MVLFGNKSPIPIQQDLMRIQQESSVLVAHEQFATTALWIELGSIDQLARNALLYEIVMDARHRMGIEL